MQSKAPALQIRGCGVLVIITRCDNASAVTLPRQPGPPTEPRAEARPAEIEREGEREKENEREREREGESVCERDREKEGMSEKDREGSGGEQEISKISFGSSADLRPFFNRQDHLQLWIMAVRLSCSLLRADPDLICSRTRTETHRYPGSRHKSPA